MDYLSISLHLLWRTIWRYLRNLYIENPKDSTQKLLELINKFSKVAEYKINIQKSVAFLYTSNETLEKEYKKKYLLKLYLTKSNTSEYT